jgi:lysophospholipase
MMLFATAENPAPEGALVHDVVTPDGIKLRAVVARQTKAKGTIFILNGRTEYCERYFEFMREMTARGLAVVTFDWRGQGASQRLLKDPLRGYVKNFSDYDLDLEAVVGLAQRLDLPEPYYAFAHSTGGQVLLRALRNKNWFKRAVISAPLLGLNFGSWPKPIVNAINFFAYITNLDWAYLPGFDHQPMMRGSYFENPLTTDRVRWNRDAATLEKFPQLIIGGPTYGWLRAVLKSLAELNRWPSGTGPTCPTMVVLAGQDKVVNNVATRQFFEKVPGFSVLTIATSKHEIIMENNAIRAKFFAAFDVFMELDIKPIT